jgi:hypothetical protein
MSKAARYKQVLKEAEEDDNIIGLILAGGRGKGFTNKNSDYDVILIVKDEAVKDYREKYSKLNVVDELDIYNIFSLSEFRNYADFGTEFAWDRYNFTHLMAQVDKTGEVQKIIDEKGTLPKDKINEVVTYNLGSYINFYYRSTKNSLEKNRIAQCLAASESISPLLTAIFALEGKIRPYNKYLEFELNNYPLIKLPFKPNEFIKSILKIIATADIKTQKEVFVRFRHVFYLNGYNYEIDSWEGKV